jgi:hypothetical protein
MRHGGIRKVAAMRVWIVRVCWLRTGGNYDRPVPELSDFAIDWEKPHAELPLATTFGDNSSQRIRFFNPTRSFSMFREEILIFIMIPNGMAMLEKSK